MSLIDIVNALPVWTLALIVIGASVCFSVGLQLLTATPFPEEAGKKMRQALVAYASRGCAIRTEPLMGRRASWQPICFRSLRPD